jgi:2-polyprenyl-3-methyl-5-hydroxy-6-metoxy-1,4-benzoquinol methylase
MVRSGHFDMRSENGPISRSRVRVRIEQSHRAEPLAERTSLLLEGSVSKTAARPPFDQVRADAFADRVVKALNDGALCLMMSIGHRTGLFDAMREAPPSTSHEVARSAKLDERYVREWLGAMVTAGVVEVDPQSARYRLPSEHATFLSRASAADNLAVFSQWIAVFAGVEDDVVECFRKGGGVPYQRYGRFHEVMREDSGQSVLSSLEPHVLPLVPGLKERLGEGIRVLDAGCGSGRILSHMAARFPQSRFTGMDLSPEAIAFARAKAAEIGLANAEFVVRDLGDFDRTASSGEFDLVTTFDAIHDQAQPLRVLKGIYRTLKTDGVYLMQDIRGSSDVHKNLDHPFGPFLYTASCLHCMTVSLAQGGKGLGAMWGEEKAREYLRRAGFRSVETKTLAHDPMNNWYVVRK